MLIFYTLIYIKLKTKPFAFSYIFQKLLIVLTIIIHGMLPRIVENVNYTYNQTHSKSQVAYVKTVLPETTRNN